MEQSEAVEGPAGGQALQLLSLPTPLLEKILLACHAQSRQAATAVSRQLLGIACGSKALSGTVVLRLDEVATADEEQRQALCGALRRRAGAIHTAHLAVHGTPDYYQRGLSQLPEEGIRLGADLVLPNLPASLRCLVLPWQAPAPLLAAVARRFTALEELHIPGRTASQRPELGLDWEAAPAVFAASASSLRRLEITICVVEVPGFTTPKVYEGEYRLADEAPPAVAGAETMLTRLEQLSLTHVAYLPNLPPLLEGLRQLPHLAHFKLQVCLQSNEEGAALSEALEKLQSLTYLALTLETARGVLTTAGPLAALPLRWLSVLPFVVLHDDFYQCQQLEYLQLGPAACLPELPANATDITVHQLSEVCCLVPEYAIGRVYCKFPAVLGALPALQRLRLKWGHACGDCMDAFAAAQPLMLSCLELDSVMLEQGMPRGITGLPSLRRLVFHRSDFRCLLTGPYLSGLEDLEISGCSRPVSLPSLLEGLCVATQLTRLCISRGAISPAEVSPEQWRTLGALPALRMLEIPEGFACEEDKEPAVLQLHAGNPALQLLDEARQRDRSR